MTWVGSAVWPSAVWRVAQRFLPLRRVVLANDRTVLPTGLYEWILRMLALNIYEMLDRVRAKPGLYIGRVSLIRLAAFIRGYRMGIGQSEALKLEMPPFWQFNDWAARKCGLPIYSINWETLLLEQSNDEDAFFQFFVLLDEFKIRIPILKERARIEAAYKNTSRHTEKAVKKIPCEIGIIQFVPDSGFYVFYRHNADDRDYVLTVHKSLNSLGYFDNLPAARTSANHEYWIPADKWEVVDKYMIKTTVNQGPDL